jgi:predicted nucleotidyltransferase
MNRNQVLKIIADHREKLANDFGVKSPALFGSVARDEATPASDLDLFVQFDGRPVGLFHLSRTRYFFSSRFLLSCAHDEQERRLQKHQIGEKHPPPDETARPPAIAACATAPGQSHAEAASLSLHFLLRFELWDAIISGSQIGRQPVVSLGKVWQMLEKFLA